MRPCATRRTGAARAGAANLKTVKMVPVMKTDIPPPPKFRHNMPHNRDVRVPGLRRADRGQDRHGTGNVAGTQPAYRGGRLLGEERHVRGCGRLAGKQVRGKVLQDDHPARPGCGGRRAGAGGPEHAGQPEGRRLYGIRRDLIPHHGGERLGMGGRLARRGMLPPGRLPLPGHVRGARHGPRQAGHSRRVHRV